MGVFLAILNAKAESAGRECVEVAMNVTGTVAVRDSKDPNGPIVRFTPPGWSGFTAAVATDDFDG